MRMWRRAGPAIAMAAAAFGAGAAGAQGKPDKATFRIAGAGFEMPLPAGYCLPTGKAVDGAQITAAGDRDNVTDLTLVSCTGEPFSSYILIKTPTTVLTLDINREQALKGLGEAFDAPDFKQKLASGELLRDSGKGVSDALGQRVDLVGEVKPLGKDEACAYVGGTADVKLTNS